MRLILAIRHVTLFSASLTVLYWLAQAGKTRVPAAIAALVVIFAVHVVLDRVAKARKQRAAAASHTRPFAFTAPAKGRK